MDDNENEYGTRDLARQLVLEAGRLMEDASPNFALRLPNNDLERDLALAELRKAATAILALMDAALAWERAHKGGTAAAR